MFDSPEVIYSDHIHSLNWTRLALPLSFCNVSEAKVNIKSTLSFLPLSTTQEDICVGIEGRGNP